jgi:hypothetical protein
MVVAGLAALAVMVMLTLSSTSLQCTARSPFGPRIAGSIRIEGCSTASGAKASTIIATTANVRNVHGSAVDHDCDQHHRC